MPALARSCSRHAVCPTRRDGSNPGKGRLLVQTVPGGFDGFFRELAVAHDAGTLGPDAYANASKRYGITWLD
jgi:hypothetical protein